MVTGHLIARRRSHLGLRASMHAYGVHVLTYTKKVYQHLKKKKTHIGCALTGSSLGSMTHSTNVVDFREFGLTSDDIC